MIARTRRLCPTLFLALLAAVAVAGTGSQEKSGGAEAPIQEVAFFIHFQDGIVPRAEDRSGVVIAVWSDGLVVFAQRPGNPAKGMLAGRIEPDQVRAVLEALKDEGFFDGLPGGGILPDGSYWTVKAVREGKTARHTCWWTDPFEYHPGIDVETNAEDRRFAKMWTLSRGSIALARPRHFEVLDNVPDAKKRFDAAKAAGAIRW